MEHSASVLLAICYQ